MDTLDADLNRRLDALQAEGLRRTLREVSTPPGRELGVEGRTLLNFASNDYLGLAAHPGVIEASVRATRDFGAGSASSRLISGSLSPHGALEASLADWKQTEAALTFGSGYAAAMGIIPALVGPQDVVILDRLVHACCVDAARLSGATLRVTRHLDLDHLESQLAWARNRPGTARILVVTESVFSMDGDLAPLQELVTLKDRFGAWLMLDEAHASGLFGRRRSGLAEAAGVSDRVDLHFGTLGKALGTAGGFVGGSRTLIEYLVNRARSFIFSTAPVPAAAAGAAEALQILSGPEGERRCATVWDRITELSGFIPSRPRSSAIIPVHVGDEHAAVDRAAALRERGLFVPAIRHPTVARGKARLRVSLTASHTAGDIARLAAELNPCVVNADRRPA